MPTHTNDLQLDIRGETQGLSSATLNLEVSRLTVGECDWNRSVLLLNSAPKHAQIKFDGLYKSRWELTNLQIS